MLSQSLKFFFICNVFIVVSGQILQKNNFTNPTGIYKTHFNNSNGNKLPQGVIKIKLIRKDRIVVSLIIQNGAPLHRSGQLTNTLIYKNNKAIFLNAEIDSTCKITFSFTSKGIHVKQTSKFKNYSCDFADGVNADGFYIKESAKVPDFNSQY